MLISAHFPLADLRGFLDDEGGRLRVPHWLNPDTDGEFVRHFGPIRRRYGGGSSVFHGEDRLCHASRALRFPRWPFDKEKEKPRIHCAFRGFYADGTVLSKFDVGIADRRKLTDQTAESRLGECLRMPVVVPAASASEIQLADAGPKLAAAYLAASTRTGTSWRVDKWRVRAGSLLLMVHIGVQEDLRLPRDAVRVSRSVAGIELARWYMRFAGTHRPVWFVRYEEPNYQLARQLRIDLVRLHCERICLGLVLKSIATGRLQPEPRSPASQARQRYLHDAMRGIARLEVKRRDAVAAEAAQLVRIAGEHDTNEMDALQRDLEAQLRTINVRGNLARMALAWAGKQPGLDAGDVDVTALRTKLATQFTRDEIGLLCMDLESMLQADGFDVPLSLDIVGGQNNEALAMNLIHRLRTRGHLLYLADLVRARRP